MGRIDLTGDNLLTLQKCLNDGVEPPTELAKALFPSLYATFDFKTLKDSKIPTIEYQGKRPEAAILNEASAFGGGSPLQLERSFDGGKINKTMSQLELFKESSAEYGENWRNLIVQGDNLQFLKTCYLNQDPIIKGKVKGKVKLIYIDPPFATKGDFSSSNGEDSYADRVDRAEFIEHMRERLIFAREVLSPDGSIYVHCDWRMNGFFRVLLDEVFGKEGFAAEIKWKRVVSTGSSKAISRKFPVVCDSVFFYTRTSDYVWNPVYVEYSDEYRKRFNQKDERGFYYWDNLKSYSEETLQRLITDDRIRLPLTDGRNPRVKNYLHEGKGVLVDDLWTDVVPINSQALEDTQYPTQKPEALLERIILASSNPGDLVIDVFAGSGTTAAVAEKLGRRWIVCDFGKHAVYTMQKRMCMIAESQKLGTQSKKKEKYSEAPKPFCVVSVGAFDFKKIMNLRGNRDAYISFVMGIFGLSERDDKLAAKYRVSNVCALKEGNPVEIYPVWDDEFLKNVRVDEDYLKGIIEQSSGSFKGDYYVIAPETCVRIGVTQRKNTKGERITFRPLTFPYKVLEEAVRNFSIEDQPNSPDNINKLVSSIGFYFNERVEVEVRKTGKGVRVTRFSTSILDREEKRYDGLEGLAMLLIDSEYDEERGFTVDAVIYQKDLKNNEAVMGGIGERSAIIAIDRHGNESAITKITE